MKILKEGWFPSEHPYLKFVTDVSVKASKCTVCKEVIPKGSTRFSIVYKRLYHKYPEKLFMHLDCVQKLVEGEPTEITCDDCKNVCQDKTFRLTLVSGHSYQFKSICELCSLSKQYRWCNMCTSLYPSFYASRIINEDDIFGSLVGNIVCNSCADRYGYDTLNTQQMEKKQNAFVEQQYLRIMTDLANDNFFGDDGA